ncbi:MAG: SxtJ family membrane protein [Candidatus Oleimicrobiaceae bacterium]
MDDKRVRCFGLVLALVMAIGGAVRLLHDDALLSRLLFCAAATISLVALTLPGLLRPVYRVSLLLGRALGWFNSQLLLTLTYYLVVTPIGLVLRLFGHDPLHRRLEPTRRSYWRTREPQPLGETYWERQF